MTLHEQRLRCINRKVFCAPEDYEKVVLRYPTRWVIITVYQEPGMLIVFRTIARGTFQVRLSDMSIWTPSGYPYFKRRSK